jgi:hypothetical protein
MVRAGPREPPPVPPEPGKTDPIPPEMPQPGGPGQEDVPPPPPHPTGPPAPVALRRWSGMQCADESVTWLLLQRLSEVRAPDMIIAFNSGECRHHEP